MVCCVFGMCVCARAVCVVCGVCMVYDWYVFVFACVRCVRCGGVSVCWRVFSMVAFVFVGERCVCVVCGVCMVWRVFGMRVRFRVCGVRLVCVCLFV